MINYLFTILVSVVAGCHASCYGAYKDSPLESFLNKRYVRELCFSFAIGVAFAFLRVWERESYLLICLSTYALSRIITEFYKLNIRVEPQGQFRIPTQIHFLGKVVHNRLLRILMGFVIPGVVFGVYMLSLHLPATLTAQYKGLVVGLIIGLADASGGAYKDGLIEGFYLKKFLKSPLLGSLGGFVISFKTTSPLFHLLGTIAFMRMFIELLFKIICKKYVPGKFKSMEPVYHIWSKRRKIFLLPYSFTWLVCVALFFL
ncbi:MAG: hypothetical protein ACFFCW_43855 [Candidatus Hodarchaeota archaeon]